MRLSDASATLLWLLAAPSAALPATVTVLSQPGIAVAVGAQTMGRGTYPRVTRLDDGSLLATHTRFDGGVTSLVSLVSADEGAAWTQLGNVRSAETATHDLDNAFALQVPGGPVLAAYRNHDRRPDQVGALEWTFFRIQISRSDDGGRSWRLLSSAIEEYGPAAGDFEPFMRMAGDGTTVQLYWSHQNGADSQDTWLATSADQGRTWSAPAVVSGGGGAGEAARDGMAGVARVPSREADGGDKLVCVFESLESGQFTVRSVESVDDGLTWGNRQTVYVPGRDNPECTNGDGNVVCHAGAPQIAVVGDVLVVSFTTDEDTAPGDRTAGAAAKLITSSDGGATWSRAFAWTTGPGNWPGLWALDGTRFLGVVERGDSFVTQFRIV